MKIVASPSSVAFMVRVGGSKMSARLPDFALIGRSFPSEAFEPLYQALLHARRERLDRDPVWDRALRGVREWRGSGERVDVPMRLPV